MGAKCVLNSHRHGLRRTVATHAISVTTKSFKSIPGLSSLPLLGSLHQFLPLIGEIGPDAQLFDKFGSFHARYGPIMKIPGLFGRKDFVIMFDPDYYEQVFRAEDRYPNRPGFETLKYYREELRQSTFQGVSGLSTSHGPEWRDFRTKVNPAMLNPKNIKLYAPGLEEIADEMVTRISKLKEQKQYLQQNFELELSKWSLESVALVGLGTRLGCLEDGLSEDHPGRQLIKCANDMVDMTFKLKFRPSPWKYISTPNFKKIMKVYDTQWDISSVYIQEAKKMIAARTHDIPEEDKSIVEKLLAIDEKVAIMMANDMLLAGIDTVAFTTMNLLYLLATNPKTQDNLRQEIRSNDGNRYLKACLKEALRMRHLVPANFRRTSQDHFVGGYHIPEGIDVIAPNQYLSNLERYYPRPKEFLPERWLADKDDPLYHGNAHPMVNLPFGYGVRGCIGRRIAELEMEIFIKKLIDKFQVSWEGPPLIFKIVLMNVIEKPFRIKFEPAI